MYNILILVKASKLMWLNEVPQEKLITNKKGLHWRWHIKLSSRSVDKNTRVLVIEVTKWRYIVIKITVKHNLSYLP
jgi:hypothetical protein